jgi:outer membrane protein OmpA-like peptidoglycan-associated protein
VQGYASAVGPDAINQPLSRQRADAVTAVLQQSGVTPTDLAYPAAMGTTGQVASNKTAEGQSQNRRVVVKLLQNKGVAGR